jgi:hypothetical protein
MITNNHVEQIRLLGLMDGLNRHLEFISTYASNPEYRGDLTDEIARVKSEINETQIKLNSLA